MTELTTGAQADGVEVILTKQQILSAPSDIVHDTVEVPEWGGSIRIRSLTAAEQAKVKQASIELSGQGAKLIYAEMEKRQFEYGVEEPKFEKQEVNQLFHQSGPSWRRVINALDAVSGTTRPELDEAEASFPEGGGDES